MTEANDSNTTENGADQEKPDESQMIPKYRFDSVNEKRKAAEAQLKELADQLIEDVPEEKRSIIPELPPGATISWLRTAFKMGIFTDKESAPLDTTRPGDKPPASLEGLSPTSMMEHGYKN
jgi:hypothetical protein